ncbi:hypothetical protein BD310DRAFT_947640 [Dichomitus squalens]|uniref:DUF159-domain-containing protein n=1 Tax=Dichomitus squalens TaxID=114155 RepID=A0A4Q9PYL8_9APHY|nr:hypothetical protein BD310DRAFT_947640 [Dichomitus squalens]
MHGYNVQVGEWVGRDQFVPRYNVAPRSQAPVIRRADEAGQGAASSSSARRMPSLEGKETDAGAVATAGETEPVQVVMQTMRWGLVPHFSKHEDGSLKTINARCEALMGEGRGMWASIKGKKRCAVVCQGYYEWVKKGKERLPHLTKAKEDRLMLLAGLWDCVTLEGSTEPLWTFAIVTTEASKELRWLHERQPVILADDHALSVWLDTSGGRWTGELSRLCAPYSSAEHPLLCYAVPKEVGKIGNDSPTFVQPIAARKDGIEAMFAKQLRKEPSTPSRPSAPKRSRSPSDVQQTVAAASKKAKAEKLNTWEDDSEIEYVHDPRTDSDLPSSSASTPKRARQSRAKNQKPKVADPQTSSAKITSFFPKK